MAAGIGGGIPLLDVGCGASVDLNFALSTIDNMINDILNGIGDITGAIADAVSSAIDALGTALSKMIPDLSGLIPDISLSGAIEGLLGLVEGSLGYLAKLAEITLQFGEAILGAGLNLFDMIADAAGALLKGLNPCSALPIDLAITPSGVVPKPFSTSFSKLAAVPELLAKPLVNNIIKPEKLAQWDVDIGVTLNEDVTLEDVNEALDRLGGSIDSLEVAIDTDNISTALDKVDSSLDSLGVAVDTVYE